MQPEGHQDPLLGAVLEGRYRLIDVLGHGGMGSVYLAKDIRLGRRYALKVLRPELAHDRSFVERFLQEAQMIAQLQHPNIVDIHSFGEDPSGFVFFTMELLEGEDLESRISARSSRPYTIRDACVWAIGIARAVAVVHEHGLIHRDLKTQNVFLARRRDGEEIIKLLDFGIARPEEGSELTQTGIALGTPSYMSPEQLNTETLDRRSDVYSFGVVLFKLFTGRLPFRGDPVQVGTQHITAPVPVPSLVAPASGITPALDALILKAMSKRRSDRHASMAEVERALLAVYQEVERMPPAGRPVLHLGAPSRMDERLALTGTLPALAGARAAAPGSALPATSAEAPTRVARGAALRIREAISEDETTDKRSRIAPPSALDARGAEITASAVVANSNTTDPAVGPVDRALAPPASVARPWSRLLAVQAVLVGLVVLGIWLRIGRDPQAPLLEEVAAEQGPAQLPVGAPETPVPAVQDSVAIPQTDPAPGPQGENMAMPLPLPPPPEEDKKSPLSTAKKKSLTPKKTPQNSKAPPAVVDPFTTSEEPFTTIHRHARKCRRTHNAQGAPEITIVYAVGSDGNVMSATPSSFTELGRCLAAAVKAAHFEPKRRLGQSISL
ncbi:serine/threonine protein kinase [Nannocystis pusilla]|uniref:serine/threonine protein kinase n=1 Tax=Nannocystis pusilla TaxID=889268 RepID=UPI003BEF5914